MIDFIVSFILGWMPAVCVLFASFGVYWFIQNFIYKNSTLDVSGKRWKRQLLTSFFFLVSLITFVLVIPVTETMKGQLLNLMGIAITATIALSSTTFVGNTMAGLMLKTIDGIKPGDFLNVGKHSGRVSEQGLLHTEIQTEERNLTTLPNLYLVTTPVTIVRGSGTMVSAHVSLGYDVPRSQVNKYLIEAGELSGLTDPFVLVIELGDFSVTYRVSGFLADVKYLVTHRSKLRGHMLDVLHENKIEIVSPSFMSQRVYDPSENFIPRKQFVEEVIDEKPIEELIFDKAEVAGSKERLKEIVLKIEEKLKSLYEQQKALPEDVPTLNKISVLEKRKATLIAGLQVKEDQHQD